jgi:hypothetical protein
MTLDWTLERLRQLRAEYTGAEAQLQQLDRHRAQIRDSLLRLEGAMRVLEEQVAGSEMFTSPVDT